MLDRGRSPAKQTSCEFRPSISGHQSLAQTRRSRLSSAESIRADSLEQRFFRVLAPSPRRDRQTRKNRCSKESARSEEHTSELQSHHDLVCRLLLEKKKKKKK